MYETVPLLAWYGSIISRTKLSVMSSNFLSSFFAPGRVSLLDENYD